MGVRLLVFPWGGKRYKHRDRPDELAKTLEMGSRRLGSTVECNVILLKRSWTSQDRETLSP